MRSLLLAAALGLAAPAAAHARAGGGGSFHSGGSGHSSYSGSSGYSGGGGYSSGYGSSYSSSHYYGSGPIGNLDWKVTLLLVVAMVVVIYLKNQAEGLDDTMDAYNSSYSAVPAAPDTSALSARDPAFDPTRFLVRAQATFMRVQEAWSGGDMTPACAMLSDGVFERFQLLLDLQRRQGRLNKLDGLRVLGLSLARAEAGDRYDVLDVRIAASCRDRYVSVTDGSTLSEDDSSFVEYWSFVRSSGARTREGGGAVEGLCPNCGGALTVNRAAVCANCKGWVNSGEFDWVLAEITQESVWHPGALPGDPLGALAHDPETTTQGLEDRASMLFWRWQRCLADKKATALEGWCSEAGLAAVEASGLGRVRYEAVGVGSVDVVAARTDGSMEEARIAVLWDGQALTGDSGPGDSSRRRTFITLVRNAGALAVPNSGLRSGHCAGCGGTVPAAAPACENCGRGFKDPAVDWVVTDLRTTEG